MTIAATILSTAHTLGQVRKAAQAQCVSSSSRMDPDGEPIGSEYRFGDRSAIIIEGRKIKIGQWIYMEREAVPPNKRECVEPECWACQGSGMRNGAKCKWNDAIPF